MGENKHMMYDGPLFEVHWCIFTPWYVLPANFSVL